MRTLKDGMKVKSPVDNRYFTKGKEYEVYGVIPFGEVFEYLFYMHNDLNMVSSCTLKQCNQIQFKNWIVPNNQKRP